METTRAAWHWPEYAIEAAAIAAFMVSASVFTVLLEHPDSTVRQAIDAPVLRRLLMGLAMGGTAMAIIYSRFGARSGAHMNPATTVTFARLGKIAPRDAVAYVAAQFAGGVAGLTAAALVLQPWIADPAVRYVATVPGEWGATGALAAEVAISFALMTAVLTLSNGRYARFTGLGAGACVATFILVEAPISGMSMNPARSFAPAVLSGDLSSIWIYFAAPLAGMFAAAEVFVRRRGLQHVYCARLNHSGPARCIFRCRVDAREVRRAAA